MSHETKQTPKKFRTAKSKNSVIPKKSIPRRSESKNWRAKTALSISRTRVSSISDVMALLRPKLTTLPLLKHEPDSDDEFVIADKKSQSVPLVAQNGNDCKEMVLYSVSKESLKSMLGLGHRGRSDMHMTFELFANSRLQTPSGIGGYLATFLLSSGSTLPWNTILQALSELSNLDVLFDEFYISKILMAYKPNNRYLNYVGTTTQNLETSAGSVVFLPDNSPAYGSGANAWTNMLAATQSKPIFTGEPWKFVMHNPTRLDWGGPLMDQSSSASSMGWCNFTKISNYGGLLQIGLPYAAAAVGTNVLYPQSAELGTISFKVTVHVRSRA